MPIPHPSPTFPRLLVAAAALGALDLGSTAHAHPRQAAVPDAGRQTVACIAVAGPTQRSGGTALAGKDGRNWIVVPLSTVGAGGGLHDLRVEAITGAIGQNNAPANGAPLLVSASRFRWSEAVPDLCAAELTPGEWEPLARAGAHLFTQEDRSPTPTDREALRKVQVWAPWADGAAGGFIIRRNRATCSEADASSPPSWTRIDPPDADGAAGGAFVSVGDGKLIGVGADSTIPVRAARAIPAVDRVWLLPAIDTLLASGSALDPSKTLRGFLGDWGNAAGYQSLSRDLSEGRHGGIVSWRVVQLKDGEAELTYQPAPQPAGVARVLAVLSERPDDDLQLELIKEAVRGHGIDDGEHRDACVKIAAPAQAEGARAMIRATVAHDPKKLRPSFARVLVIEACAAGGAVPPLPALR